MDSTISKCKKLYSTSTYENEKERSTKSSKSRTSSIESSVSKTPPVKQSAFSKSQFDEKRSASLESIKENTSRSQDRKKQSIISKLSMKKEEEKLHLRYEKLTSEPPDLNVSFHDMIMDIMDHETSLTQYKPLFHFYIPANVRKFLVS